MEHTYNKDTDTQLRICTHAGMQWNYCTFYEPDVNLMSKKH